MLAALDCSYVIVGHSERRKYHPEDDATLVDETRAILTAGMHPILCVGESYDERKQGIELEYAVGQVNDVTRDLSDDEVSRMLIAYEPVWAIGTGMVATAQTAQDAAHAIREHLASSFSTEVAERVRILYGGSVNSKNASQLMTQAKDMDGFLVGGASLDPDEFSAIVRLTQKAAKQR